jgi:hypothetical protein
MLDNKGDKWLMNIKKTKNYIVVEATYGEEKVTSEKIMAVIRHGINLFPEVFDYNTAFRMQNYKHLGTFAVAMTGISEEELGEGFNNLMVTLISGEDDAFIWSVDINIEGDNLSYGVIDWRKDGETFKYQEAV